MHFIGIEPLGRSAIWEPIPNYSFEELGQPLPNPSDFVRDLIAIAESANKLGLNG